MPRVAVESETGGPSTIVSGPRRCSRTPRPLPRTMRLRFRFGGVCKLFSFWFAPLEPMHGMRRAMSHGYTASGGPSLAVGSVDAPEGPD
jgi:hypothetical protein